MDVYELASERGYAVDEVTLQLEVGESRQAWLVYDVATRHFVVEALDWTTEKQVVAFILESS